MIFFCAETLKASSPSYNRPSFLSSLSPKLNHCHPSLPVPYMVEWAGIIPKLALDLVRKHCRFLLSVVAVQWRQWGAWWWGVKLRRTSVVWCVWWRVEIRRSRWDWASWCRWWGCWAWLSSRHRREVEWRRKVESSTSAHARVLPWSCRSGSRWWWAGIAWSMFEIRQAARLWAVRSVTRLRDLTIARETVIRRPVHFGDVYWVVAKVFFFFFGCYKL